MRRLKSLPTAGCLLAAVVLLLMLLPVLPEQSQAKHPAFSCDTCHVARDSSANAAPLWNPELTGTTLNNDYRSPTLDAKLRRFDGASRLCLGCHDGSMSEIQAGSRAHIGRASQSHPVSFVYDRALAAADGALRDPSRLPPGALDAEGKMQCSTCHDVHANPAEPDKALRWPYVSGGGMGGAEVNRRFCNTCHIK